MSLVSKPGRRPPRVVRRVRRWWRSTPRAEITQTLLGLGLLLIVIAAVIAFTA